MFSRRFLYSLVACMLAPGAISAQVALPTGGTLREVDFERHVMGLLSKSGCNSGSCHGSFQGKGGFRLSLFGYDPAIDAAALTRDNLGRRVNVVNAHPLFFGLYGDDEHGPLVYHHGGGFRKSPGGRVNRRARGEGEAKKSVRGRAVALIPKKGPLRTVRRRLNPARRVRDDLRAETRELSDEIYGQLEGDEEFWRRFV